MDQLVASGSLKFVDILSHVQPGADSLRPLLDLVQTFISDASATTSHFLVILDGVSTLEWLGFAAIEVGRLSRALSSLCRKVPSKWLSPWNHIDAVTPSPLPHYSSDIISSTARRSMIPSPSSNSLWRIGLKSDPSQVGKVVPLAERSGIARLHARHHRMTERPPLDMHSPRPTIRQVSHNDRARQDLPVSSHGLLSHLLHKRDGCHCALMVKLPGRLECEPGYLNTITILYV